MFLTIVIDDIISQSDKFNDSNLDTITYANNACRTSGPPYKTAYYKIIFVSV